MDKKRGVSMGWYLRRSDDMNELTSIDGKKYWMRAVAKSFFEGYIFYDENGNEIEQFMPDTYGYGEVDDMYETDEHVVFEGRHIRAKFTFEEFGA